MNIRRWSAGFFLLVAGSPLLLAQSESASVVGTVTDASGATVPGAVVTVRDTQTNSAFAVQTAQDGNYASPPLRPGSYSVTVEATGFTKIIQNINLDVDQLWWPPHPRGVSHDGQRFVFAVPVALRAAR